MGFLAATESLINRQGFFGGLPLWSNFCKIKTQYPMVIQGTWGYYALTWQGNGTLGQTGTHCQAQEDKHYQLQERQTTHCEENKVFCGWLLV